MAFVDDALTWLVERAVYPDGHVVSWRSPERDGFAYPEAAAFVLHLWSIEGRSPKGSEYVAETLSKDIDGEGGLGKDGRTYAFDAAVALAALTAHRRRGGRGSEGHEARLAGFVARLLSAGRAIAREDGEQTGRWSRSFGPHLIKAAARLGETAADHRRLAAETIAVLEGLFEGARFPIHARSRRTYLHAHAYALEGLLLSRRTDSEAFVRGVEWLARIQQPGGGIPAWHDGVTAAGPARSDATGQAIRLWCALDRSTFGPQIDRGVAFLERMRSADGGVLYEPGSADANTSCTVFAIQARRWADAASFDPGELI